MSICGGNAPDTSGVNAAAVKSAAISQEALDWFKNAYAQEAPARAAAAERSNQVADAQVRGMNFATDQAMQAAQRQQMVQQPLENSLIADAQGYDTPERRAAAAERATANVEATAGRAQQALTRDIMRRGGTVNAGDNAAIMADAGLKTAGMISAATDQAERNVEQQGYARKIDAASLLRNLPATQATQQQIASTTGNAAVNAGTQALGNIQSGNGLMQTGFGTALQGQQISGNLYGQAANIDLGARGQDLNFMSSMAPSLMKLSSKKVKKNRKPTNTDAALKELNALPVDDYEYDPAKGGPAGQGPQTGPMAEDVNAEMGERVAPGGRAIDYSLPGMGGKIIAGIQTLSKRVDQLETAKKG